MRFPFLHLLINTLYLLSLWWQPFWQVWGEILWFWFAFPWLVMLSILCLLAICVFLEKCLFRSSLIFYFYIFSVLNVFVFNWKIIALQYYVGFCQISACISHLCTYIFSSLNLLPTSHPILHLCIVTVCSFFFFYWVGFFFLYWVVKFSCSLDVNPLLDLSFTNIFSHSAGCFSVLLAVFFAMQKPFSLM